MKGSVKKRIITVINKLGNIGAILHVKANNEKVRDSYDEYGNEIILADTETQKDNIERLEFKYIQKNLRGTEIAINRDESELIRVTGISTGYNGEDILKNNVFKGDVFETYDKVKYSIDEVNHIGEIEDTEIILELICSR